MTVREDMIRRSNDCLALEATGDFGARIMRFAILGAMERMSEEELEREIDFKATPSRFGE